MLYSITSRFCSPTSQTDQLCEQVNKLGSPYGYHIYVSAGTSEETLNPMVPIPYILIFPGHLSAPKCASVIIYNMPFYAPKCPSLDINLNGHPFSTKCFWPWPMWHSLLERCCIQQNIGASIPVWVAYGRQPIDVSLFTSVSLKSIKIFLKNVSNDRRFRYNGELL